uniref:NADH-ubiquinone oxidoreductase chain 6 n=1 Tax=Thienemanniella tusimufegea TaxID=3072307 RepID=A0AA51QT93_9DIPT|nr:NADH dehydrogenase subunit 6 [Thienemanniella tusimufegea]WML69366.1 NADH dehydrogenase subunit 6 [Thienemanniella tusimufegea]
MMKTMLMLMTFLNGILFMISKHPLSMGLILLIQTLLVSLMTSLNSKNYWFSYILFLIFLGGMLILFIYVISLASNEKFNFSLNTSIQNLIMLMILTMMFFFIDKYFLNNLILNYETLMNYNNILMNMENSQILNKMFNFPTNMITILLMIYLFLCLIAICKIIYIFEGPLRPKF